MRTDLLESASHRATYQTRLREAQKRRVAELKRLGGSDAELARLRKQCATIARELDKLLAEAAKQARGGAV